ncbi:MAG: DUF368 domain-containing protein [Clostridium sp.]|nr:DUF368 domain-containing protein [Clostridium sp.]
MNFIKDILRGILIGIANAIPGVSGGTMMVSMGIYDKIISSVTNITHQLKKSIITLMPYAIGMGVGIIGLSFAIEFLFTNYPVPTSLMFIGLILGGVPMMLSKFKGKKIGASNGVVFLIFFSLIFILQWLNGKSTTDVTLTLSAVMAIRLFFVGVIAAATMVIPGVSGSMILMILGFYTPVIEAITTTIKALVDGDFGGVLHQCFILAPFGIGVLIGIYYVAKLIELLLRKQEGLTYSGILGLIAASPFVILMQTSISSLNMSIIVMSAISLAVGFSIAYFLGRE